jgi:adhesin transport system outer membrane protein
VLEQARLTVAYGTASALLEMARQQKALKISDQYVARMRELVDMLSQIAEVDPGRGSELVQARARLLQAETARDLVVARLEELRATLVRLVDRNVEVPEGMTWDWPAITTAEALAALPNHPSLLQAGAEVEAARSTASAIKAARLPRVNWVIERSTEKDVFGDSQPWSSGLTLEWKAFQGGSAAAAQQSAREREGAAEAGKESMQREAEYRIRNTAKQRDLAQTRTVDYESLVMESDRVRQMYFEQWHHLGKRTLLDVLTAENEYYNHQIAANSSFFDVRAQDLRIQAEARVLLQWLAPPQARKR